MDIHLNLMPWRAHRRQRRWRHSLLALVLSVLMGGMAWWRMHHTAEVELIAQRQHQHTLTEQLTQLSFHLATLERHAQQQHTLALTRARLEHERLALLRLLDALATRTPEGAILTEAQWQGDTLTLTVQTANNAQMTRTVQQWDKEAGNLQVLTITSARDGGETIRLSVPWSNVSAPAVQLAHTGTR